MSLDIGQTHYVGDDCDPPHEDDAPSLTLDQVSGMLHAASTIKSRISELELTAQRDRERIAHALEVATESDRRRLADIIAQVEGYWLRRLEENPAGKKSVVLPWARIESRERQPEYVRDDAILMPWAIEHLYVKRKTVDTIDWERIKRDVLPKQDVPGVTVVDRPPSVKVTID